MNFLITNNQRRHQNWLYDFDRFFEPIQRQSEEMQKSLSLYEDIEESADHILLSFDVPGMKEKDFSVKIEDNHLVISGERKREESKDESNVVYSRRSYGKFQKSFLLPETVDATKVEADYRDGVLRVYLPKTEKSKDSAIDVKVKVKDTFFDRLLGRSHKEGEATVNKTE